MVLDASNGNVSVYTMHGWQITANNGALGSSWFMEAAASLTYGTAVGDQSTAMSGGFANGNYSVAMGASSTAAAYQSVVLGRNNAITGTENATAWVDTDPLFVIGNGTGNSNDAPEVQNRNALTVYKNGDMQITGKVNIVKRQGDILMGEFGN